MKCGDFFFKYVFFFLYFSGPDYKKDYLPKIHQHMSYVGEKRPALEKTGDLRYYKAEPKL